ncbi:hypothetical protein GIB67_041814 [Kingdonia uniflora]|uniref:Disease resistance R13L4/SHOC-2-like LRR domain-containing protein n=1 Tax=Kingdonia uniflora TaxID=39325 RepID=A0A7J7L5M9_9MAGN|nr:hypothetical protein GIB67_041814 [Kingdonia uniflora]
MGRCVRMSLMRNDIRELPDQPQCPQLLTLSLAYNKFQQIPDGFFEDMKGLVTLDLSNCQRLSSLPRSLSGLKNLRTLNLNNCRLEDASLIGNLTKLEVLNLESTRLKLLPQEIGELTNLKFLNLLRSRYAVITPNVISKLSSLEELRMNFNKRFAEVASLSNLTTLHLNLYSDYELQWLSTDIGPCQWEKLTKFRIYLGSVGYQYTSAYSRSLSLTTTREVKHEPVGDWVRVLLESADQLRLYDCKGLENPVLQLNVLGFNNLRYLVLIYCIEIEYLISMEEHDSQPVFAKLEILKLTQMFGLKAIYNGGVKKVFNSASLEGETITEISTSISNSYLFQPQRALYRRLLDKVPLPYENSWRSPANRRDLLIGVPIYASANYREPRRWTRN